MAQSQESRYALCILIKKCNIICILVRLKNTHIVTDAFASSWTSRTIFTDIVFCLNRLPPFLSWYFGARFWQGQTTWFGTARGPFRAHRTVLALCANKVIRCAPVSNLLRYGKSPLRNANRFVINVWHVFVTTIWSGLRIGACVPIE